MSFNNYDQVVQTTTNSCGAFALAAALDHIGKAKYIAILDTDDLSKKFNAAGPEAFAQSIYQVTGCLKLGMGIATYQYLAPVENTNPPSALAYMAVQHGTDPAKIHVCYNNAAQVKFLGINVTNAGGAPNLLDTERALIWPAFGTAVGPTDYVAPPVNGEVQLLLVKDYGHWIAINSANEVYDPGTGFVGPYVADPEFTAFSYVFNGVPHSYTFSGMWIQLS